MLVRKIELNKWMNGDAPKDPLSADVITNCLKTKNNTLSVWYINDETELEEAVLAIVSGQDHLDKIDVVLLEDEYFVKCKIAAETTDGFTPIKDLKNTHRDLSALDIFSIGLVAEHIVECIKTNKQKQFRIAELKNILKQAIIKKRLELSDLKDDIQKKIV